MIIPALILKDGEVIGIEVDMGPAILNRHQIPMVGVENSPVIGEPVALKGVTYHLTCVSMGNPHAVIFMDAISEIEIESLGPQFESHSLFPEKTNTEFVQILNKQEAVMRVWERGAGETLACGTGACAVTVAGVLNGLLDRKVLVHLPGGQLSIEWLPDGHVMMSGPATTVYTGEVIY